MKNIFLPIVALLFTVQTIAQDTFSIVAVDSITGEIGSAGASCLDNIQFPGSNGAYIISDVLPGRGAIHTQAAYTALNQSRAHDKMVEGLSPQEIVDWMKTHDSNLFNANTRQYGVVDFDANGSPRAAAHTGPNCFDYKNHIVGPNYAIQGNILLGQEILDSMEANFLKTSGTLADKLMAALQGANVPGADTRCLNNGTSSLSAFLRVAKPTDDANSIYLDLNVPSLPAGQEPIDSVQTLYDNWLLTDLEKPEIEAKISVFPNPSTEGAIFVDCLEEGAEAVLFSMQGKKMTSQKLKVGRNKIEVQTFEGVGFLRITNKQRQVLWSGKILFGQ